MTKAGKTFRVFISSTFSDLKEERNALQENVFPRLRDFCKKHGCHFQAIDLRWGVSEEASLDQQTMRICLDEIKRCQKTTPRPNFIVLLGDRYGWRPLPFEIPADEFDQILSHLNSKVHRDEQKLLNSWYRRDDNSVPPVYCLQSRTGDYINNQLWIKIENSLRDILTGALDNISIPAERKRWYFASATEHEIRAGLLTAENAKEHVFCFFREIEDLINNGMSGDYIDIDSMGNIDLKARESHSRLKIELSQHLPEENIYKYSAKWAQGRVTTGHIEELCEDVYKSLEKVIKENVDQLEEIDSLDREIQSHDIFREEISRNFVGRLDCLNIIEKYIKRGNNFPLVIFGPSGSGKSALLARSISRIKQQLQEANIIYRFIGVTPESKNILELLSGILRQILSAMGMKKELPDTYDELNSELNKTLALATREKPIIIIIDALDQINFLTGSNWIPLQLPHNVGLIVSSLSGEWLGLVESHLPEENIIKIPPLTGSEGTAILNNWLAENKRTLTHTQFNEVIESFKLSGTPLYLKLAFEEARLWKSYTSGKLPSTDVPGIIRDLLNRLSSPKNHGKAILSRCLGYIAASKNGLTEGELLDILSKDRYVFNEVKNSSRTELSKEQLPVVLWSRLFFDLQPYLAEQKADRTRTIVLFHRQFSEIVINDYLKPCQKEIHRNLAAFFYKPENASIPRRTSELPYHQTAAGLWEELYSTLINLNFIRNKFYLNKASELVQDFQDALQLYPCEKSSADKRNDLESYYRFILKQSHLLREYPDLTYQQAYNQPDGTAQARTAGNYVDSKKPSLFRFVNKPAEDRKWKNVIMAHNHEIGFCAWSPDSRQIASSASNNIRISSAASGESVFFLGVHTGISSFYWSPDGAVLAVALADHSLLFWEPLSGKVKTIEKCHDGKINCCSWSPDGKMLVSVSDDRTVKIWDAGSLNLIKLLSGHKGKVNACVWSPAGSEIFTCSDDKTIICWNARPGSIKRIMKSVISSEKRGPCTLSPDGKYIISLDGDCQITVWDAVNGWREYTQWLLFMGTNLVSPDGQKVLSIMMDNEVKILNISTGKEIVAFDNPSLNLMTSRSWSNDNNYLAFGTDDGSVIIWDIRNLLVEGDKGTGPPSDSKPAYKDDFWEANIKDLRDFAKAFRNFMEESKLHLLSAFPGKKNRIYKSKLFGSNIYRRSMTSSRFSRDGSFILCAYLNSDLVFSDIYGKKATHISNTEIINSVDISPDNEYIACGCQNGLVKIISIKENKIIFKIKNRYPILKVLWSPNGRYIAVADDLSVFKIIDIKLNSIIHISGEQPARRVFAWSPDAKKLVLSRDERLFEIYDLTEKTTFSVEGRHEDFPVSLDWSPDGRKIVSMYTDSQIIIRDAVSSEKISDFFNYDLIRMNMGLFGAITKYSDEGRGQDDFRDMYKSVGLSAWLDSLNCSWSPDGTKIFCSFTNKIAAINPENGKIIAIWISDGIIHSYHLNADGTKIYLYNGLSGKTTVLQLINANSGHPIKTPLNFYRIGDNKEDEKAGISCSWCNKAIYTGEYSSSQSIKCDKCGGDIYLSL